MKTYDMRRTKSEKDNEGYAGMPGGDGDYHHGLNVELDHHSMRKVKMTELPKPGDEYHGEFHGRVTHASEEADEGGEPRRRIRVVMHHMGMEPKDSDDEQINRRGALRSSIEEAAEKADKARTGAL